MWDRFPQFIFQNLLIILDTLHHNLWCPKSLEYLPNLQNSARISKKNYYSVWDRHGFLPISLSHFEKIGWSCDSGIFCNGVNYIIKWNSANRKSLSGQRKLRLLSRLFKKKKKISGFVALTGSVPYFTSLSTM